MQNTALPHQQNDGPFSESILRELDNIDNFYIISDIFKHLGDPTRTRLFWLLCHCEECVTNISAMMNMSSPAISHHLRLLKNSGLILCHRKGKEVYYHAADTEVSKLLHKMIEQVMEITCPS